MVIAGLGLSLSGRPATAVAVVDVVNETGNAAYDPLARATSELIVTDLTTRGLAVRRDGAGGLRLASKLVMWDGLPYLGMTSTDASGAVRWSAMIKATEGAVPQALRPSSTTLPGKFVATRLNALRSRKATAKSPVVGV